MRLAALGDAMNPIAIKELRQAVRGRFVVAMLSLSLIAEMLSVLIATMNQKLDSGSLERSPAGAGLFVTLFTVLFLFCVVFIPMYCGLRLMRERSDTNIDLVFITTIKPRSIILGKLLAAAALAGLLFSASMPFLVFSYVLRGIDFITILVTATFGFVIIVGQCVLGLFIGAIPASRPFKLILGIFALTTTLIVYSTLLSFTSRIVFYGGATRFLGITVWQMLGIGLLLLFTIDFVLLVATTALISPPAANRALPLRTLLAILWAVTYAACFWSAVHFHQPTVLTVWAIAQLSVAALVLFSAIGEREEWGPRVARTIPRRFVARLAAFPFFSGGGGTLWALGAMAATLVAYRVGAAYVTATKLVDIDSNALWMAEAAMCCIGYATLALLVRRSRLGRRVPARATWAIALVLFLLLAVIPPLLFFALYSDASRSSEYFRIVTVANPFPMTDASSTDGLSLYRTAFLAVWALLGAAANGRWLASQFARFHRPA
jgi:hypothetical protein